VSWLQRVATAVNRRLGPDSRLSRAVRGPYGWVLERVGGRAGIARTVNGVPVRVLPRYRQFFTLDYDAPVAAFLRDRVKPGAVCLNIGANTGVYTLQLAHWSAPTGRVYAFEPNPETAAVLRRHVELNRLADRVEVVPVAVGREAGTAPFYAAGADGMSRLGRTNPALPAGAAREVLVEVTTLDRFCSARGLRPDWVVMDIEGFEVAALLGGRDTLRGLRDTLRVVVEFHPAAWPVAGTTREQLEELLGELRLRPVPLGGQKDPWTDHGIVYLEPA
jgi:FkbM family methyltransferase